MQAIDRRDLGRHPADSWSSSPLGDTQYIQDPTVAQVADRSPPRTARSGTLNLGAGTIRILDQITDTTYEGEESKGGAKTYHINGQVAARGRQGDRRVAWTPPSPSPPTSGSA